MMAHMLRAPVLALALSTLSLAMACGSTGSDGQSTVGPGDTGGGGTAPGAVPTAPVDTGGLARQGDACDYGGAERYTCTGGLECCYGEHQRPDGYGSCQPECNWD